MSVPSRAKPTMDQRRHRLLEELAAFDGSLTAEELAELQGVGAVESADAFRMKDWPADGDVDDFIAAAMAGRRQRHD